MTEVKSAPSPDQRDGVRSVAHKVALNCAAHGWPVLPGSTFNGKRFVKPGTDKATDGVRPIHPRNYATTDAKIITGWWTVNSTLTPTVLLRSGLAFDVLSVARPLAEIAVKHERFRDNTGPVVSRSDENRAYFLVTPGEIPAGGFAGRPGEIKLIESGGWILIPPAQVGIDVHVKWWIAPEMALWKPAPFHVVRDVLTAVAGGSKPSRT